MEQAIKILSGISDFMIIVGIPWFIWIYRDIAKRYKESADFWLKHFTALKGEYDKLEIDLQEREKEINSLKQKVESLGEKPTKEDLDRIINETSLSLVRASGNISSQIDLYHRLIDLHRERNLLMHTNSDGE